MPLRAQPSNGPGSSSSITEDKSAIVRVDPDPRGPGKLQFACAAVGFVGLAPLRVKICHSSLQ